MHLSRRLFRIFLCISFGLSFLQSAHAERVEHLGCYAEWDKETLTIGNTLVERQWRIEANGLLRPVSFYDKLAEMEWLRAASRQPAPFPELPPVDEARVMELSVEKGRLYSVEAPSLLLNIEAKGRAQSLSYSFQVFPDSAGITLRFDDEPSLEKEISIGLGDATELSVGLENASRESERSSKFASALEDFQLSVSHPRYTQVERTSGNGSPAWISLRPSAISSTSRMY